LLEPIQAGADVDYGLAAGIEGASDVGGDGVVGAAGLGGHADIVIGHAEAEYGDAQHVEGVAERGVGQGVGIPVGEQHDGPSSAGGKPAGIDQIVFGKGRAHGRGEAEEMSIGAANLVFEAGVRDLAGAEDADFAALEAEVGGGGIGVELVAVGDDAAVVIEEKFFAVAGDVAGGIAVAARPVAGPLRAPLQRPDNAIVVNRGEAGLPIVHPLLVARRHTY